MIVLYPRSVLTRKGQLRRMEPRYACLVTRSGSAVNDPVIKVTAAADAKAADEWWARWERLPRIVRDRPAADVLAEQRDTDD